MGSSQSLLSPEAALTIAVVAGAVGFGYSQRSSDAPTAQKGKKQKASAPPAPAPIVVPFPTVIPGGLDGITEAPSDPPRPAKSKKKKKSKPALTQPTATRQLINASIDTDGSWTRVHSHRNKPSVDLATTSASEADPATGTSSPVAERMDIDVDPDDDHFFTRSSYPEQRRPLAERMLPKPRKTGVESMLETPDNPTLARVMRVSSPQTAEQPASGFSWGDYEDAHDADVDGEDDNGGWDVVKSRRPRTIRPFTSEPSPSQPKPQKAPETLTKRQRQNAARRETQKALKEEAEQERRLMLARHQRELENERMKEQTRARGGKKVSGGMKAVVSDTGKLVWE